MKMRLINGVILAEDYPRLVKWYEDTFKLERKIYEEEEYHYSEMMKGKNMIFGIADASENGFNMKIRTAQKKDYSSIVSLWKKSELPFKPLGRDSQKNFEKQLNTPNLKYFLAFENNEIIGYKTRRC
ncbi:MAG: hypothetical protein B6D62_03140 [Candidatus Cloacimonas sp. 4484_275]|nr:MAG: hypothetical protein B6D62_03140 [Candidatus Cloacimonas sp. 4484_275]